MTKSRDNAEFPNIGVTLDDTQTLTNKTLAAPAITGNTTTTGTFDGRDVAGDGAKLDGVEAGAKDDQTGAEIKVAYEAEADTNAYDDAAVAKLAGIAEEAGNAPTRHSIRPSLLLDFANSGGLDPRITFTRASTATYFDAQGVLQPAASGEPRFDHDPITGESLGLLIEESRTNLFIYSEQFNQANWVAFGSTVKVSADTAVAPDGTTTADKITLSDDGATPNSQLYQSRTVAVGDHTISCFVRSNTGSNQTFRLKLNDTGGDYTSPDFTATTDWQRFSYTYSLPSGGSARSQALMAASTGETANLDVWGAQLEAGAFPTSYVTTTTAQVTRAADNVLMTGTNFSDWYNQVEGAMYIEASPIALAWPGGYSVMGSISDGTAGNRLQFTAKDSSHLVVFDGGVLLVNIDAGTFIVGAFSKYSTSFKENYFAVSIDGGSVATDTAGTLPTVDQFLIGGLVATPGYDLNGHIKKLAYYPKALTDAELVGITS